MTVETRKNRSTSIFLAAALISVLLVASFLTIFLLRIHSNAGSDLVSQSLPMPISLQGSSAGINETVSQNATNSNTSPPPISTSYLSNFTTSEDSGQEQLSSFLQGAGSSQMNESEAYLLSVWTNINEPATLNVASPFFNFASALSSPISLSNADFNTRSYGEYPAQNLLQNQDPEYFNLSFPDCISWGQMAGADAVTSNSFAFQEISFDAAFVTPKTGANGFDEMAIFAASDTVNYKGTEFGIRLDLRDGCIYGYVQEPTGNLGEVNFQTVNLMPNDGMMHQYSIVIVPSYALFSVDTTHHSFLSFQTNGVESNLTYSVCAVEHRFSNYWDSTGDGMIAGNFTLN